MSAINPASFASPTLGIQAPSGIGPGAVGVGRASGSERRQAQQPSQEQQPSSLGRGFRPAFVQPFAGDRSYPQNNYAYVGGVFGNSRAAVAPYAPSLSPGTDGFSNAFGQSGDYQSLRQRFSGEQSLSNIAPHSTGASPMAPQTDWAAAFQGLSLNTH